MAPTPPPRVAILTLGCASNLVDSERIASMIAASGVEVTHRIEGAGVIIVNTCGFIEGAKQESIDAILDVASKLPAAGRPKLIVTGCLAQRYGSQLGKLLPEVDSFTGLEPRRTAELALRFLGRPAALGHPKEAPRACRFTPPAWSYLRIAEGCDNRCAYCAIPSIRGPLRSSSIETLVREAEGLAREGVRELNVVAQDTANYGLDLYGERALHTLLRRLCRVSGIEWIRLLYVHPAHLYDELIEVLAGEEKLCPYLDVPLQHINDDVLRRMGRRTSRGQIEQLLSRLRDRIPGLTLRTTFLVGFPGETEEQFEELLDFVRQARFDRVGCFAYSDEEGTPAASLPGKLPARVGHQRRDRLMATQQSIAFELAGARVGERTRVLVEECSGPGAGPAVARSRREAPDVDPVIYVHARHAVPGEFMDVQIVASAGYDCIARAVEERADG